MSDGRSFLQPNELSYSERLSEIERKIPIFLDKIQSYDTLFDMNEKYRTRIAFLSQQNDILEKKLEDQKKEQQQQKNDLTAKHEDVVRILNNIIASDAKNASDQCEKNRSILETQVMHMRYIDGIKKSIENITSTMPSKQDIEDVKKLNNTSIELLRNRMDAWTKTLTTTIDQVETNASKLKETENEIYREIVILTDKIKDVRENISKYQSAITTINENSIPSLKKDVVFYIENVKKLIPEIPPIDSIKKDIQDQMQRIELDGKNAVLRASNNEKSVEMMKKQIENIYLLLKKHELNQ